MSPQQPPADLLALAHQAAKSHGLPPELVCAVIEQESSWDPFAVRYEPAFFQRYIEPLLAGPAPLAETESRGRAFSWGLMQVMGQVAREHGYTGSSLAQLCEPDAGIEIGCRVLAAKLAAAEGNILRALLLWNGGANRDYPQEVLARTHKYAAAIVV